MKNILLKLIEIFLLTFIIINIFSINTYAADGTLDSTIKDSSSFLHAGSTEAGKILDTGKLSNASNIIYNTLLAISFVVVAIVGITLGIKFLMADANGKAEVKKAVWPFVIGTIVAYGAFGIWKLIVTFLNNHA